MRRSLGEVLSRSCKINGGAAHREQGRHGGRSARHGCARRGAAAVPGLRTDLAHRGLGHRPWQGRHGGTSSACTVTGSGGGGDGTAVAGNRSSAIGKGLTGGRSGGGSSEEGNPSVAGVEVDGAWGMAADGLGSGFYRRKQWRSPDGGLTGERVDRRREGRRGESPERLARTGKTVRGDHERWDPMGRGFGPVGSEVDRCQGGLEQRRSSDGGVATGLDGLKMADGCLAVRGGRLALECGQNADGNFRTGGRGSRVRWIGCGARLRFWKVGILRGFR